MDSYSAYKRINKIEMENNFNDIKSDFILRKFFGYLERKILLDIIKYNKNIKKRIHININDYKEYSELYSSIEIEIIPRKNEYCKIINIKEEDKKYYHIYFNYNKEDIKRDYVKGDDKVRKIKIIIDSKIQSFSMLFFQCKNIESISFTKFYRKNIIKMNEMFRECLSLKNLNLNNFNTCNVTDMSGMFAGCTSLKKLNLNNFNTNNVKSMEHMFFNCTSLKELNLDNFKTNNVSNMGYMFWKCSSLKELNLNNFITNKVWHMCSMFAECKSLKKLHINNFNTSNVTDMNGMFAECKSLKELNLNNFNTNNVRHMYGMFSRCSDELKKKIEKQYKNIRKEAFD